jgi:hypothetical protein
MRPPWSQQPADADLEALQTDVMRFVAILGLCLAAIFSLLQGVAREPAASPPASAPRGEAQRQIFQQIPGPEAVTPSHPASPSTSSSPAAVEKQSGFSLEFSSDAALLALIGSGKLQLYARLGNEFRLLEAGGGSSSSGRPQSYYQMRPDTVPLTLRHEIQLTTGADADEWGVQLNAALVARLQEMMRSRSHGALLIDGDGRVRIDSGAETGRNP